MRQSNSDSKALTAVLSDFTFEGTMTPGTKSNGFGCFDHLKRPESYSTAQRRGYINPDFGELTFEGETNTYQK